ncbi:hypothetical protein [Glycomyces buryatensis]|uniref:Uncharacterized protein n=1 Tax=Glycomyces buryatensis TaxID=2570927 RepID=A0A4S8QCG3_9ACTN|nr:hypothetical protein [Glycomyces buryatensis]THV41271.1 hypothetical protein FAB82_12690 [Glycomyces buryatensis]
MPKPLPGKSSEIVVADRVRLGDLLWFAAAAAGVVATPWILIDSSDETVEYRDANGFEGETVAVIPLAALLFLTFAWVATKAYHLLRGPAAGRFGPDGVRLYPEGIRSLRIREDTPAAEAPWDEVKRLVLWHRREKLLFFIPGWRTQLGLEKTIDYYAITAKEPTEKQRTSADHRKDGSPVRLGHMLLSRSVEFHPRGARSVADAVAAFAPHIEVVDERRHGVSRVIEPQSGRSRRNHY